MQYPLQRWSLLLLLFSFFVSAVPLTPAERGEISQRQSDVIEQAQRQREEITRVNRVEPSFRTYFKNKFDGIARREHQRWSCEQN
ncbi:hypothetical protein [Symbiopectobacterium sp.]|uniref:hypothetical protein n=1 Tax=Symbiopectobacterium sp. TaxID=2952789 RepID=UPI003F6835C8